MAEVIDAGQVTMEDGEAVVGTQLSVANNGLQLVSP